LIHSFRRSEEMKRKKEKSEGEERGKKKKEGKGLNCVAPPEERKNPGEKKKGEGKRKHECVSVSHYILKPSPSQRGLNEREKSLWRRNEAKGKKWKKQKSTPFPQRKRGGERMGTE